MNGITKRDRLRLGYVLLSTSLILFAISLLCEINYYGWSLTWTIQQGFIGVYWGDDSGLRASWLRNGFLPPMEATGAGQSIEGRGTWEVNCYAELWISEICDLVWWREPLMGQRLFGFWKPIFRLHDPAHGTQIKSCVLPLWLPILVSLFIVIIHRKRRPHEPEACNTCGYDLRGISNRCPECGTLLQMPRHSEKHQSR
ncbi:MAG: hypothetical protein HZA51_08805 [Planctomycetes bacterium]|nr:hypothetical protein [Planctomycetota bacterium]